jgi:hypothetical protein
VPATARQSALQYLAHQPPPPAEAVAAVASLLDTPDPQLRQMALLAYGACALNLRTADPARADAVVSVLLERWAHAPGDDARADLITAMGNAGSARALPALEPPIARRELRLGLRAVGSLRFIDDDRVDRLLGDLLGIDGNESFRRAAIETLRFRPIGPFAAALTRVALHDPVPEVRNLAVALLGDRLSELPTLRGVLEEVRKTDALAANRAAAARFLTAAPR